MSGGEEIAGEEWENTVHAECDLKRISNSDRNFSLSLFSLMVLFCSESIQATFYCKRIIRE